MPRKPAGEESKGKPYMDLHKGTTDFLIPKGVGGYEGHAPKWSAKQMVGIWLLALMAGGDNFYGRELRQAILTRSRVPGIFAGYQTGTGVIVGLLNQWAEDGIVELVGQGEANNLGNPPKLYRITDEGRKLLEKMKVDYKPSIIGSAMTMNRLYADVFGHDLLSTPATIEEVRYAGEHKGLRPRPLPSSNDLTEPK